VSSQPKWSWNPQLLEITALAGIALGYPKVLVFITCTLAHVWNNQSEKTRTSQSAGVLFVIFPPIAANAYATVIIWRSLRATNNLAPRARLSKI
jgi:hypothetical protein